MSEGPYPTPAYPLTLPIPLNIKGLDVLFWMRPFTVDTMMKRYRINYPYASLYLQKSIDFEARKAMDPTLARALSYAVSTYNLEDVKNIFQMGLDWLSPQGKELLYGTNDNGMLVFNGEYRNTKATHSDEYSGIRTAIQLTPTLIEVGQGVMAPGIVLYINRVENALILREYEFIRLANFIITFNFTAYTQFAMQCFQYSLETGQVLTYNQVQERFRGQQTYNSNLRY